MCGISGIFNFYRDCGEAELASIHAMNDRLVHRGPDDEGSYISGPIALGHRRLSIIDLSSGKQPMCNEDETIWVVFNGEIYNYRTLQNELIQKGHRFRTRSDTEVIVHLYEEFGEEVFSQLNGMFAVALWDARAKKLILARDRVGKKPLYYHFNDQRLAFASEIKALLALPHLPGQVDPDSLDHYLSFFYVPSPETIFSNVAKLEPATYLVCQEGKVRKERYWSADFGRRYAGNRDDAAAELTELLGDAVQIRLESEVPLGAFLSGGIDSSAIVALMARSMEQPVKTTSIGFGESSYNELAYARAVAGHCHTDHREQILPASFIEYLPRIVYHFDEPFADSSALPTYLLCQAAREHVTVALSGDGGDENFAGYDRYPAALSEDRWRHSVPSAGRALALSLARNCFSPLYRGFTALENLNEDLAAATARTVFCFSNDVKQELYRPAFRQQMQGPSAVERFLDVFPKNGGLPPLSRLQTFDLKSYLPEDILTKVDRMSMAHSLEVRSPLLDYRVVELAASLPPEWKLNGAGGKLIFKQAMKPFLPAEIFARKKMGFSIPVGEWFRNQWRALGETFLLGDRFFDRGYFEPAAIRKLWDSHQKNRPWLLDLGDRFWTLLVLEVWHRIFIDGEAVDQVTEDIVSASGGSRR
jgi:asparagine synthase (glutamine-hydrolysing)